MSENCIWYVHGSADIPDEKRTVDAACIDCAQKHDIQGMFWEANRGYGEYDLDCKLCGKPLHRQNQEI